MQPDHADIVVVGASLAGLSTAEALRAAGFTGDVTLIGAEKHLPYHRPPLSKQVMKGTWSTEQTQIRTAAELESLNIDVQLGTPARALDTRTRTVAVGDRRVDYDRLVIATGTTTQPHPSLPLGPGVLELRTLDDAIALRAALPTAHRVAVVGAGILGCEIASALQSLGHEVTLIGRSSELRFGGLGAMLSSQIVTVLSGNGVDLRLGVAPVVVTEDSGVRQVHLADGSAVPTDLLILSVGCTPATAWLTGSGLQLDDGVLCDANGQAAPHVFAVGDVAAWTDPRTGLHRRIEHQQSAIEQANAVARLLVHGENSPPITPFFWSELFGTRILAHGTFPPGAAIATVAGDPSSDRFILASTPSGEACDGAADDAQTLGLVAWNMPRELRLERAKSIRRSQPEPSIASNPVHPTLATHRVREIR